MRWTCSPSTVSGLTVLVHFADQVDGTTQDVMHMLPYLESYIFHATRTERPRLVKHLVLGVSLGGHAAWQLAVHEPAIHAAVVVIGTPNYAGLMSDRARLSKLESYSLTDPPGTDFFGSSDFPSHLIEQVRHWDPQGYFLGMPDDEVEWDSEAVITKLKARLSGKRILSLSGQNDRLVPHRIGSAFLRRLESRAVERSGQVSDFSFEDCLVPGVGHEMSKSMVTKAKEFIIQVLSEKPRTGAVKI